MNTEQTLKVALVEDSELLCEILLDSMEGIPGVEVIGHVKGEDDALELLRQAKPRLVIVDLELEQGSGFGLLESVTRSREEFGNPKMAVFSNHGHPGIKNRCHRLGVDAFFDKAFQMDDLLDFITDMSVRHN